MSSPNVVPPEVAAAHRRRMQEPTSISREPAPDMDFGPWRAEIVGPRILDRFGYEISLTNKWMRLSGTPWWAWTKAGARRKGRRLIQRWNQRDADPEVIS